MLAPSFLGMQSMPLSAVWPVAADHMMAAVRPSVGCLAAVSFRMDAKLKKNFESIIQMMGLNMTTAFTVFAIQVVNEGRIPFAIKADPFWCAENQARLRESIAQLELGKVNEHDLIEGGSRKIARN